MQEKEKMPTKKFYRYFLYKFINIFYYKYLVRTKDILLMIKTQKDSFTLVF